jgi:cytochrome c oxidase assembly protein subunit 15
MKNASPDRPVAIWLLTGVVMIIVQIILGGITRLTGSGLSITEWDVVTGSLPPLNEVQWSAEFEKYRQTAQYNSINFDFSLRDFKFIFFWEWVHRFWARLIGIVFAIPFIVFLVQGRFKKSFVRPLVILFLLGALQGLVGWIMVQSGLTGDAIYVAPTRLALHFVFAMVLLAYTFWFALKLLVPGRQLVSAPGLKHYTWWIVALLGLQFIYGALMAGHRAAPAAPTWPDINGSLMPDHVFRTGWAGLLEDRIVIHFVHRTLAYILVVLIVAWTVQAVRIAGTYVFSRVRLVPIAFVVVQVTLGVMTVLTSTGIRVAKWNSFEWMAQLHQFVALLLLLSLVFAAFLLQKRSVNT